MRNLIVGLLLLLSITSNGQIRYRNYLSNGSLTGTTINSGTITGGTISNATISGTSSFTSSGNIYTTGNMKLGAVAVAGSTTPNNMHLGGTYSTVAGANGKLILFDEFGFGVSAGQLDYMSSAGAVHTFYAATTKLLGINTVGATFTVPVVTTQFKLSALNTAPASAAATGTLGEIRIVNGFIYVCVATNTWQRAALTTF